MNCARKGATGRSFAPAKARSSRPQVRSCGLFASFGPNLILHNEFSASAMPPQPAASVRRRPATRASRRSASSVHPTGCVPLLPQAPPEAPARNNRSIARKKTKPCRIAGLRPFAEPNRSIILIDRSAVFSGEDEIRTRGTFSKPVVSATHPPLRNSRRRVFRRKGVQI